MKKIILIFIIQITSLNILSGQNISDKIINSFKTGNSHNLALYLENNIILDVISTPQVFSKKHAEIIIQKFFKNNPPKDFVITDSQKRGSIKFFNAEYYSKNGDDFTVLFELVEKSRQIKIRKLIIRY